MSFFTSTLLFQICLLLSLFFIKVLNDKALFYNISAIHCHSLTHTLPLFCVDFDFKYTAFNVTRSSHKPNPNGKLVLTVFFKWNQTDFKSFFYKTNQAQTFIFDWLKTGLEPLLHNLLNLNQNRNNKNWYFLNKLGPMLWIFINLTWSYTTKTGNVYTKHFILLIYWFPMLLTCGKSMETNWTLNVKF